MQLNKNGMTIEVPDAQVVALVLAKLTDEQSQATPTTSLPPIGSVWPGQGGTFAGIMRGRDGGKDYALILGPQLAEGNFKQQLERAAAVDIDGHKDFRLPYRKEQSLLFANVADQFHGRWYWSCERHQANEEFAWSQIFGGGGQSYGDVNGKLLACAVRGFLI